MFVQRGYTSLKQAFLAGALLAPLGWLLAFLVLSLVLGVQFQDMAIAFFLCWFASAALSPLMHWADKRAVLSGDPRFIVFEIGPYALLVWLVFGYSLIRQNLMTPTACIVLGLIVGVLPLALLWWWRPQMVRKILEERRRALTDEHWRAC